MSPASSSVSSRNATLTLGVEAGLDFAIANPEHHPAPLPRDHPMVDLLRQALQEGRPIGDETQETAGFRQAEAVMRLWENA